MPEAIPSSVLAARLMAPPHVSPKEEPAHLRALMASAQAGDAAAYSALLRECVPLITRMARQNGVDPGRVDDVVQDTLMTVHRARHTFDPSRPFTPWLRAIVLRRGIDVKRRTGRQASRELHAPLAYEAHPDPDDSAEQVVDEQGRAGQLLAALDKLPPGQREALEKLGLQERSLAEVSAETGKSVVSLKVSLHRAIKSLRQIMGPDTR
jgi:RNA polymerase sigma-70 factor (ECF subfamily)